MRVFMLFVISGLDELATIHLHKNIAGVFECKLCGKHSRDRTDGKRHLEANHFPWDLKDKFIRLSDGKCQCLLCDKVTSHKGNMRQHFVTHHLL